MNNKALLYIVLVTLLLLSSVSDAIGHGHSRPQSPVKAPSKLGLPFISSRFNPLNTFTNITFFETHDNPKQHGFYIKVSYGSSGFRLPNNKEKETITIHFNISNPLSTRFQFDGVFYNVKIDNNKPVDTEMGAVTSVQVASKSRPIKTQWCPFESPKQNTGIWPPYYLKAHEIIGYNDTAFQIETMVKLGDRVVANVKSTQVFGFIE
jgi:hypothetical protein